MKRRAGILGHGYMGSIRRAVLEARSDCEVVRIFAGDDAGWQAVVDDPEVDCVFVCLPNHLTCEAVCRSLAAGKDVLAEKPPGRSLAEVQSMRAAEAQSGKVLKFGFNHRYHPAFLAAQRRVEEGLLGGVTWLRGRYGRPPGPDFARTWRADAELAGGGVFLDQGIHMLDLMLALCPELSEVRAFASASPASPASTIEEDLVAILRGQGGRLASLHSTRTQWQPIFSLEVGLTEGSLVLDGLLSRSGCYGPERLRWRSRDGAQSGQEVFDTDASWSLEIDELFDCARRGVPVRVGSSDEALRLMTLVEAIYAQAGWTRAVH